MCCLKLRICLKYRATPRKKFQGFHIIIVLELAVFGSVLNKKEKDVIILMHILDRKDIYKYFP